MERGFRCTESPNIDWMNGIAFAVCASLLGPTVIVWRAGRYLIESANLRLILGASAIVDGSVLFP
jgi:hypothetical protein